jgi:hypothetical protein
MLARHETPRAATIVQAVQKAPELIAAESDLDALQEKGSAIQTDLQAKMQKLNFPSALRPLTAPEEESLRGQISAFFGELKNLEARQSATRRTIDQHRPAHAQAVRVALAPLRRDYAERVVAAIAELQLASAGLQETVGEIEATGARARRLPIPPYLDGVAAIARLISAEPLGD